MIASKFDYVVICAVFRRDERAFGRYLKVKGVPNYTQTSRVNSGSRSNSERSSGDDTAWSDGRISTVEADRLADRIRPSWESVPPPPASPTEPGNGTSTTPTGSVSPAASTNSAPPPASAAVGSGSVASPASAASSSSIPPMGGAWPSGPSPSVGPSAPLPSVIVEQEELVPDDDLERALRRSRSRKALVAAALAIGATTGVAALWLRPSPDAIAASDATSLDDSNRAASIPSAPSNTAPSNTAPSNKGADEAPAAGEPSHDPRTGSANAQHPKTAARTASPAQSRTASSGTAQKQQSKTPNGPSSAPTLRPTVRVQLQTAPASARLSIDGNFVSNPFDVRIHPDGRRHRVEARANGFETRAVVMEFDHDVSETLELSPKERKKKVRRRAKRKRPRSVRSRTARTRSTKTRSRGAGFTTDNPY